jgi:hypothetical protein
MEPTLGTDKPLPSYVVLGLNGATREVLLEFATSLVDPALAFIYM